MRPGRLADNDRVGLGERLQPRRKVWSFAHRGNCLGSADTDQIARDDQASGNADAHRKLEWTNRVDDRQACAHRAFGMRLIGIRPAEIRQHAIADEAGDIALLAGHRSSNAAPGRS